MTKSSDRENETAFKARRERRHVRIGFLLIFTITALYTLFFVAYRFPVNSDNMYFILAAEDILAGNRLLSGWHGGFFSALTGDILLALPFLAVAGRKAALYLIGPVCCGLIAAFAFLLVRGAKRSPRPLAFSILTLAPIFFFPAAFWFPLTTVGMHAVAIAQIIVLIWLTDRLVDPDRADAKLAGWIGFALCVAFGCIADGYVLYFFAAPLLLIALLDGVLLRRKRWLKAGLAASGGIAVSKIFLAVIEKFGGLMLNPGEARLIAPDQFGAYLRNGFETWARLFTRTPLKSFAEMTAFEFAPMIGLAAAAALTVALRGWTLVRGWREEAAADKILFLSGAFVAGSFILTRVTGAEPAFRYFAPAYFCWLILIARSVGACPRTWSRWAAVLILLCVGVGNLSFEFRGKAAGDARLVGIADALKDRGVERVYGTYWETLALTYYSGNRIQAAPVVFRDGTVQGYLWSAREDWYARGFGARCLVVGESRRDGLTPERIEAAFGPADEFLSYYQAEIYCYDRDLSEFLGR